LRFAFFGLGCKVGVERPDARVLQEANILDGLRLAVAVDLDLGEAVLAESVTHHVTRRG